MPTQQERWPNLALPFWATNTGEWAEIPVPWTLMTVRGPGF